MHLITWMLMIMTTVRLVTVRVLPKNLIGFQQSISVVILHLKIFAITTISLIHSAQFYPPKHQSCQS